MSNIKLKVGICGGGIGGLCLAVALDKYPDIQVDLYEAAGRFTEIGAGIMMWGRTWHIFEQLGIADELGEVSHAPPDETLGVGFDFRRSDQPTEGYQFYKFQVPYGTLRFHRAQFLDVFVNNFTKSGAHFGKRLASYNTSNIAGEPVTLRFVDGSTASCDVLIGCDGIKSTIRKQMFEEKVAAGQPHMSQYIEPTWSGTVVYRGLYPVEKLKQGDKAHRTVHTPVMYCGKGKHIVSYAIARGDTINVAAMTSNLDDEGKLYDGPSVTYCPKSELLDCYAGWEPEVKELIQYVENPMKWAIHELRPLPFWVTDQVALLGDAAHGMTPHLGAGAGQAIEDAYVLAAILGDPGITKKNLSLALGAYERVRIPLANHIIKGSAKATRYYEFDSELGDDYPTLTPAIEHQWDWLSESRPEDAIAQALQIVDEGGTEKFMQSRL